MAGHTSPMTLPESYLQGCAGRRWLVGRGCPALRLQQPGRLLPPGGHRGQQGHCSALLTSDGKPQCLRGSWVWEFLLSQ